MMTIVVVETSTTAASQVVLAPSQVQLQRVQPQSGKGDRWLLRPLIAGQNTPAPKTQNLPPLPSTLPPATFGTQHPAVISVPAFGGNTANPVTPSTATLPNAILPPATFGSQQPGVVSVPALHPPPYKERVIEFGQPLPKAMPKATPTL